MQLGGRCAKDVHDCLYSLWITLFGRFLTRLLGAVSSFRTSVHSFRIAQNPHAVAFQASCAQIQADTTSNNNIFSNNSMN